MISIKRSVVMDIGYAYRSRYHQRYHLHENVTDEIMNMLRNAQHDIAAYI